ncbi:unnamed protein product [Callosobruchus maculatus]|uniref:Uncharacterized protein n=1 Tax=Callosobruchus maculatus TaxID=64391 RepID=A0A653D1I8_CALMS|nr:unnamed protein product [Callosobruchus maculatus]
MWIYGKKFLLIVLTLVDSDTGVDDICAGANSIESALALQKDLIALLRSGCFELKKGASNDARLLTTLSQEECQIPMSLDKENSIALKVLGLQRDPKSDIMFFSYSISNKPCTKRNILSNIASIFDPLGGRKMYVYRYILYINLKFGARTINFIFVGIGNHRSEYFVSIQTGKTYIIRSIKLRYKEVLRDNCSTKPLVRTHWKTRTSTTGPSVPSNEESRGHPV